jgi:predicted lipoprotein
VKRTLIALVVVAAGALTLTLRIDPLSLRAYQPQQGALTKQSVLNNIARTVMLRHYEDLNARAADLVTAVDALALAPDAAALGRAQQAWAGVLMAWRRSQGFIHGPVADLRAFSTLQFFPPRPQSVDRVLKDTRPIDAAYVEELGATAAGLFPLELLLFDMRGDHAAVLATLTGPRGPRQRAYVKAMASEIARKVRLVTAGWQGPNGYAARFAAGGQDALNLLVNDLLAAVETNAQDRLRLALEWQAVGLLKPELVEGGRSGTSQRGIVELLVGAERTFTGGDGPGLDDYLARVGSTAGARTVAQFQKAIAAVQAIGGPLDRATVANPDAVKAAREACRALEMLLKIEVASALGVTITFKATDGD